MAQSIIKAYITTTATANQVKWLRKVVADLGFKQEKGTMIFVDNQLAIAIAKNPVHHGQTKHVKVKYHALRKTVNEQEIELRYCNIEVQLADILTKGLSRERFETLKTCLGVSQITGHGGVLKQ